jgi:hypothetical protein
MHGMTVKNVWVNSLLYASKVIWCVVILSGSQRKPVLGCEMGKFQFKRASKLFVDLERRNLKWK